MLSKRVEELSASKASQSTRAELAPALERVIEVERAEKVCIVSTVVHLELTLTHALKRLGCLEDVTLTSVTSLTKNIWHPPPPPGSVQSDPRACELFTDSRFAIPDPQQYA